MELFSEFVQTIQMLPKEAFLHSDLQEDLLDWVENELAENPSNGKLQKLYEKLQMPVAQRKLLKRLETIAKQCLNSGKYNKAADRLEKHVIRHIDGQVDKKHRMIPGRNWIVNPYRQPVYEQGLALVAALEAAATAEKEKKGKHKGKTLFRSKFTPSSRLHPMPARRCT
jgi:hypothetical protein